MLLTIKEQVEATEERAVATFEASVDTLEMIIVVKELLRVRVLEDVQSIADNVLSELGEDGIDIWKEVNNGVCEWEQISNLCQDATKEGDAERGRQTLLPIVALTEEVTHD